VLAGYAPFWVWKGGCAGKRGGELGTQRDATGRHSVKYTDAWKV
jgi:hypothetical protein